MLDIDTVCCLGLDLLFETARDGDEGLLVETTGTKS